MSQLQARPGDLFHICYKIVCRCHGCSLSYIQSARVSRSAYFHFHLIIVQFLWVFFFVCSVRSWFVSRNNVPVTSSQWRNAFKKCFVKWIQQMIWGCRHEPILRICLFLRIFLTERRIRFVDLPDIFVPRAANWSRPPVLMWLVPSNRWSQREYHPSTICLPTETRRINLVENHKFKRWNICVHWFWNSFEHVNLMAWKQKEVWH